MRGAGGTNHRVYLNPTGKIPGAKTLYFTGLILTATLFAACSENRGDPLAASPFRRS